MSLLELGAYFFLILVLQGAFELGCTVCPIAIKYNKIFVDAFWNSKKYVIKWIM
jgi:hypothetical protein